MKQRDALTQSAFDTMLAWLDRDRDQAGQKYERIRQRLIKVFACRGCCDPEDLADETINRVVIKAEDLVKSYEGDPALYFYGVAQKVHLESLRKRLVAQPPLPGNDVDEFEQEYNCLEQCMERLPEDNRKLVLRYYQEEKHAKINNRKELARELGIAINALRIRAHRIRAQLQLCVQSCVGEAGAH